MNIDHTFLIVYCSNNWPHLVFSVLSWSTFSIPGRTYCEGAGSPLSSFAGSSPGLPSWTRPTLARFPDPLAFGSGSGLQCVYTVVISLWGTPAAKFVLESSKMLFYWIAPCIRKPQAEFHKISTTHVSPSSHWMPSTQSPLLIGTKDSKDLSI